MFVVGTERRAWWPVTWTAAAEDGAIVENKIELRFRLLDVDQLQELEQRAVAADATQEKATAAEKLSRSAIYAKLVGEIAVDWKGPEQELSPGGATRPLDWSEDNLVLLMKVPGVWQATLAAYRDCLSGREKVREGN